jgi:hypothetical protein
MAERKPLFMDQTEGYHEEMATGDSITLGGLSMGGAIDMNESGTGGPHKITNAASATADGDVLVYGQTGADLDSLNMTGNITMNSNNMTGLPSTPSGDTAAASKAYVDSVAQGLDVHDSVRAATTAALTLASDFENGDAIDGVTLATNDRILIKDQGSGVENGIYIVQATGAPTRATDWAIGYTAAGAFVFVEEGTANGDNGFVCTNNVGSDVTGTDALTFSQFSGAGQITAAQGLVKSGNQLDVELTSTGGLQFTGVSPDGTLGVKPDTTSTTTTEANAVITGANGLSVKVDDSTIEGSLQGSAGAESLRLKDGGITGAKLASDIAISTTGNIETTAGTFTGDGSGLTNLPSAASTDALTVTAKKASAGTIAKGKAVYITGYSDPDYLVELADADTGAAMPAIGIAGGTITDAAAGTLVIAGKIETLDTSSFSAGDPLYVSTTAGDLTATKPTGAANLIQKIAQVVVSNASTGIIQVFGAGRSNDIPNIAQDNLWIGNASGVGTSTPVGNGLSSTPGTSLAVNITADIGLQFNGTALEIELDNTPDTLDADASGLKVVGVPDQFKINDSATNSTVTATALNTLTASSSSNADAYHTHSIASTEAPKVESDLAVDEAIAVADPVYFTATGDRVGKADATTVAKSRVIGVARTAQAAVGSDSAIVAQGEAAGVLSGATPGTPYYLADSGGIATSLPAAGSRVILVGYAASADDLWVAIRDYGRKAS